MTTRTRTRSEAYVQPLLGYYDQRPFKGTVWSAKTPCYGFAVGSARKFRKIETTCDELHEGPPYMSGGPFDNFKSEDPGLGVCCFDTYEMAYPYGSTNPSHLCRYVGGFQCSRGPLYSLDTLRNYQDPLWSSAGLGDSSSYGATGWKMFQPNKPVINLGQDAYELRELPKMMQQTAMGFYKSYLEYYNSAKKLPSFRKIAKDRVELGNQWLNTNFGWAPFYKSVLKLLQYQEKCAKRYEFLQRTNGEWMRRKGVVDVIANSEVLLQTNTPVFYGNPFPGGSTLVSYGQSRARTTQYVDTYKKVGFTGKFRYYIPDFKDVSESQWSKDYVNRLGLNGSPSLLYELTPWSWLIDWFSNLGDVLENLSTASEHVTSKYAYITAHTLKTLRVESTMPFAGHDLNATWRYVSERKQRVGASPFGFNLSWPDFSGYQLGILGALGISRF